MTEKKQRRQKHNATALADSIKTILMIGPDLLSGGLELEESYLKEIWKLNEDALVKEFIAKRPGRRPWAWWKWSCPKIKRRIIGEGSYPCGVGEYRGKYRITQIEESDFEFLKRTGNLISGEESLFTEQLKDVLASRKAMMQAHVERKERGVEFIDHSPFRESPKPQPSFTKLE